MLIMNTASIQTNLDSFTSMLDGVWEVQTYTRKGKVLKPSIKVHYLFNARYFNEICFENKKSIPVNPFFYSISGDIIQLYYDEERTMRAESFKVYEISETSLKLEAMGDDFKIDNWSSTIIEFNRINPKS
jgi:hypothetical protein